MEIRRGEIYLVDFDPPRGEELKAGAEILKKRPAVVLTRNVRELSHIEGLRVVEYAAT